MRPGGTGAVPSISPLASHANSSRHSKCVGGSLSGGGNFNEGGSVKAGPSFEFPFLLSSSDRPEFLLDFGAPLP
jgi:hypothetical protein